MKRISVTGWVPAKESETDLLDACGLRPQEIREWIKEALIPKKVDAVKIFEANDLDPEVKRVRVTVEIDVEVLSK